MVNLQQANQFDLLSQDDEVRQVGNNLNATGNSAFNFNNTEGNI
jgi:hypothetical protein